MIMVLPFDPVDTLHSLLAVRFPQKFSGFLTDLYLKNVF